MPESAVLTFALARAMGGTETQSVPSIATNANEGTAPDVAMTEKQLIDAIGIHTTQQATAVAITWLDAQKSCTTRKHP